MTQNNVDYSGNPSGAELMDDYLAKEQSNFRTTNSGVSRPSYAQAGTVWIDTSVTPWLYKMYDGAQDIILGKVDITNNKYITSTPMTTTGDIMVQGSSGDVTRLAPGAAGTVLTSNGAGQLPSYKASDLTQYGKLSGNQTWTGINTFKNTANIFDAPSGSTTEGGEFRIAVAPSYTGSLGTYFNIDTQTNFLRFFRTGGTATDRTFSIDMLNGWMQYGSMATLPSTDSSLKVPPTQWVQSRITEIMNTKDTDISVLYENVAGVSFGTINLSQPFTDFHNIMIVTGWIATAGCGTVFFNSKILDSILSGEYGNYPAVLSFCFSASDFMEINLYSSGSSTTAFTIRRAADSCIFAILGIN